MTMITPLPDTEYGVREWIRTLDVVGQHAYFGVPDVVPEPAFVTLARVGGAPTEGTAALDGARLSLSVWGVTKKAAGDAARQLMHAFEQLEGADIGNGVYVHGATPELLLWQPDPETARPRYIVDVLVYASATIEGVNAP